MSAVKCPGGLITLQPPSETNGRNGPQADTPIHTNVPCVAVSRSTVEQLK